MASDQMVVAALGRPFTLGTLYDAHKDELITAFTPWDKKTLQENSIKRSQQSSVYEITASDSIESKSSLLDIEASLRASFLCGLVEVGGSAKYLNDKKKSNNQSRVTFQYKATTMYEQLTMAHLEAIKEKEVIENCSATHVVTGILYGANAFFVFDSDRVDASSVQNIQGSMEAVIKKIPSLDIEGRVDLKLSDEEKALTKKFSCKFYGDFILESNPATFEEAVKTYQQLPKLLGEDGGKTVPVKVWLTPLKNLDSTAPELKGEICVGLLRKAENALEKMREIEMRCNDSLEDKVVKDFPLIFKKLSRFQDLCNDYTTTLQRIMKEKFPSIREGKEDESSVEKLLDAKERSPFSHENLKKWLSNEERKINVIRSCVELEGMEGLKIVPNQSELDREVLNPNVDDVLCFVFTSLETTDPYLDQTATCHSHDSQSVRSVAPQTQDQWYFSDEVVTKMRAKARVFISLKNRSRVSFLLAAVQNEKYEGATIYQYRSGCLVTDDFSKPPVPDVTTVTDRQDLIRYACDLNLDPDTTNGWLTLSEGNKKATSGPWQTYSDLPQRFDTQTQVLCREGLTGCHYWEVEWSEGGNNSVGVGVTYDRIGRKGNSSDTGLGSNCLSWYFGVDPNLCAWHNGKVWSKCLPPSGCRRVGVFLDWPAGSLSFYKVSNNTLSHLYTFEAQFTEPLYPGFYVYHTCNYAALCTDLEDDLKSSCSQPVF
ncbi:neoverrucotoxin subunit alpha-like [Trachinotus anak]|uniref:neoverrucotoxin subunit alpha-like n=1 Tax=Trachinotus anak TaxID=443729 RepID=UPI0039F1F0DC